MSQRFHLVEFRPWPILTAGRTTGLPVGLVLYIKGYNPVLLGIAGLCTAGLAAVWWRDVTRESTHQGHHSKIVVRGLIAGFICFVASEVCFFVRFFWAFYHSALAPTTAVGCRWPPAGIVPFRPLQVPLLNTGLLLLRGVRVTWAHHSLAAGRRDWRPLAITLGLGIAFLGFQKLEYAESTFSIADGVYGRCFFLATGFHGLHVLCGAICLAVALGRWWRFHFNAERHWGFLAAAWYWHFVDVVWLALYIRVYWWGA